jgi:hypothetical protein
MRNLTIGIERFLLWWILFYWICFTFPFPLDLVGLPFGLVEADHQPAWMKKADDGFTKAYTWIEEKKSEACVRVGQKLLHVEVTIQQTGSGDTMRAYVGCLCAAVISGLCAVMWSGLVPVLSLRKPAWKADAALGGLVRILVRFFLIDMLFGYGFAKIFAMQFPAPDSYRFNQHLGDMSPMGLLWTFMGYSTPFQIFTGAVEVLGGLLLVSRRTTFLGALVTATAMAHVLALNLCFDVPVKLYSFHYLLMAVFLAAPDLPRLAKVIVLGRALDARPFQPLFQKVAFERSAIVIRTLLVAGMLYAQIKSGSRMAAELYGQSPPPVVARWEVVSMSIDKKDTKKDDAAAWKWIDVSERGILRISTVTPPNFAYRATWNSVDKSISLTKFIDPTWKATLTYDLPQPDKLKLTGTIDGKTIAATLRPSSERHLELKTRGYHWIQEMPYNR